MEFAGEVAEVGPGVSRWKVGQRVFGIVGGGAYAEYLVTHERLLAEIPDALSYIEAAAVPEAFITAHDALVTQAAAARVGVGAHPRGGERGGTRRGAARRARSAPSRSAPREGRASSMRAKEYGLEDGWAATENLASSRSTRGVGPGSAE